MANKARTPMTTAEEIIAWAEKTREANGEAFTMLNKEEQLLIAKFMLAMRDHIKTLQNNLFGKPDAPSKATHPQTAETTKTENLADECRKTESAPEKEILERDIPDKRQTNMEFFKANNISMQRAFQLYQTWANVDPSNRIIMDEERKAHIKSASFAFWLNLPHE